MDAKKPYKRDVFALPRYMDDRGSQMRHFLCPSDAESFTMNEILEMADDECKALWEGLSLAYTEHNGHPLLRKEVTKMYQKVKAEDLFVLSSNEGIYIGIHCIIDYIRSKYQTEDFHAVVTFPAFQNLYENIKTSGVDLSLWELEDSEQGWMFDLDKLQRLLRKDTRLLVVNFPHNPSGYIPTHDQWRQIVDICKSRDIILFSDEVYRLTNNDGTEVLPSAVDCYNNAVTLCSLSKAFGLPGLRIGWLACRIPQLVDAFLKNRDYMSLCPAAPSEILALIGLKNKEKLLKRTMEICNSNLKLIDEFVKRNPDIVEWHKPRACTTGFMKIKGWLLNLGKGGATRLCDEILSTSGILLLPAKVYEYKDDYVRVGFGRRNFKQVLEAFEDFIVKHAPKSE